jgi:hypothetical protein
MGRNVCGRKSSFGIDVAASPGELDDPLVG